VGRGDESAWGPDLVIRRRLLNVRIAPESGSRSALLRCRKSAISGREQSQQDPRLFDHLVGAREQRWRHFEAERFRGLEVDHKLVLCRLLDWYVGGFCAA